MNYRVIKNNDVFLLTDHHGDIRGADPQGGLYMKDTRFLSKLELSLNGKRPLLLSSAADENYLARIRLTNEHEEEEGVVKLWRESVELVRERFVYGEVLYETISATNFSTKDLAFDLDIAVDADFSDMFLIRGFQPAEALGKITARSFGKEGWHAVYDGVDGVRRETRVTWDIEPDEVFDQGNIRYGIRLKPKEAKRITLKVIPSIDGNLPAIYPKDEALSELKRIYADWGEQSTKVETDSLVLGRLYERGMQDLRVLLTDFGQGLFPVAGLPWFAVPFGRDSLIAALQMLPLYPTVAKGTLEIMAAHQGMEINPWKDEQPGKIMHEMRSGELARSSQVPFAPYYGSIDSTPLFIMLAAEYAHWTGDMDTVACLLPNIERALEWIDRYGDRDGDGWVEYYQESSKGIANQGWKDSADSVIHKNGEFAHAPVALVEVQGYVFQAKQRLAPIVAKLGKEEMAKRLTVEAAILKSKFDEAFWMEKDRFYAIALDGDKRQVQSVTSNPGHLLMSGIVEPERAREVARRLVAPDMFGGYGIRTMSNESTGYNPMSYHDGSVWPHDNSLAFLGMGRMGFKEEAATVISGLLSAAEKFEYNRLPELFCGYDDSIGYPVSYPVACSPQAWAAGTSVMMIQTILGLKPDALEGTIVLDPFLPDGIDRLIVRDLPVASGRISVALRRKGDGGELTVEILSNDSGCDIKIGGKSVATNRD
ncbi:amylo-alpha-1,6-glucosidase [Cohnella cholangitidis]|uniref:Amylo-alpha-1,6-glucosidase n=1 Tax=Cohnella cholangitidis TaxID=2598458 RepID=A0A7G5C4A3_9BACL|nr:amylo-alpha-1,6-glucosidase [Cohnella cholangitidis]QMV44037.1 amylo-alpha-1,6-glucosidase [Cohnella cholangitidis]